MPDKHNCLVIVPARGGSKGIKNKNKRLFLGRPLIEWTLETAIGSGLCERIIVSTDDPEIAEISLRVGGEIPFIRPERLSRDNTTTSDVIRHAVDWLEINEQYTADYILVLEPTSPGRQVSHIEESLELLCKDETDSVVSLTAVSHHYSPLKQIMLEENNRVVGINEVHPREMIHRRQDIPLTYAFDGAIFSCKYAVIKVDPPSIWGRHVKGFVIDNRYSVDLDEVSDWVPAEDKLRPLLIK